MTNFQFCGDADKAKEMYDKYARIAEEKGYGSDRIASMCDWLYRSFDGALQLDVGDVIQIKEHDGYTYARVDYLIPLLSGSRIYFQSVKCSSAKTPSFDYEVKCRVGSPDRNCDLGECRKADLPKEFLALAKCPNLEKCPLKTPGCTGEEK